MSTSGSAPETKILPSAELCIHIHRDRGEVVLERVEIHVGPSALPSELPQQLRWSLSGTLLPDELLIVYGKPLSWAGPHTQDSERLPHVEDAFPSPLTLGRNRRDSLSGAPRVRFPDGTALVAWPFGVVLLRGQDTPLMAESHVRIRRIN